MKNRILLTATLAGLCLYGSVSTAAIVAVNTGSSALQDSGSGSTVLETTAQNIAFDAGGTADALIVTLSSESNASAGQVSITYDGNALTPVIDHAGSQPSIWLLNLGGTSYAGGSATLVLDMTGVSTANGYGLGIVSVDASGDDIEVHDSNTNASPGGDTSGQSVSLTTTDTSFVVAAHRANSGSGGATSDAPLNQIYSLNIGSSFGGAGYDEDVAAGNPSFSFTSNNNANGFNTSAAAFTVVPEPASLALLGLGGLLIARRRR